jgi:hypothetical protein
MAIGLLYPGSPQCRIRLINLEIMLQRFVESMSIKTLLFLSGFLKERPGTIKAESQRDPRPVLSAQIGV